MYTLKILCGNSKCKKFGEVVNTIAGIESAEELDLMIEQWHECHEKSDICSVCKEVGIPDEYL